MRKFGRKALALTMCLTLGVSVLATGCGGGDSEKGGSSSDPISDIINSDASGEVSIMVWNGDDAYHEDIGHAEMSQDELTSRNVAQIYAVAHKFNESYPNVKVNVWSKAGDPDQVGTPSWDQEMENFKADYGKYPDIWASTNVIDDMKKGLVADLSGYKDDAAYKSYNETLMAQLNYYGFQAGLPSYSIPWGIWVNKALATDNNIEVPDPDWDIDDFTDFITQADCKNFWGLKTSTTDSAGHDGHGSLDLINMGVTTINQQISESNSIDLASDEVSSLLKYINKWASVSIDSAEGAGQLTKEIAKENKGYTWYYFCNNRALVNMEDPWYLTTAADESAKASNTYVNSSDWDFYPFPSTDYVDNTIRLVMDPICLHNYALDDGNNEMSKDEQAKLDVTYAFATYWTASTEARQAIKDQKWTDNGEAKDTAASDSFPVVNGEAYDAQMEIWNSIESHKCYADKEGFQKVVELFKNGNTKDYVDKCWYKKVSENGESKYTLFEWINCGSEDVAGAWATDKNWVDVVKSKLSDWNETINKRIQTATEQLQKAMKDYYGYTDADFK